MDEEPDEFENCRADPGDYRRNAERERARSILELAAPFHAFDLAREHIARGTSIFQFREEIMLAHASTAVSRPRLTRSEISRYSLTRAIAAFAEPGRRSGFEVELSADLVRTRGPAKNDGTFIVPTEVLVRDLTAGTASAGGYLVSTDNVGFVDMLRNRSVALRMGAQTMSGLRGNVTLSRQTGGATGYWLATEGTQTTESQQTFTQIALTPKTVAAYTEVSRQLLLQSSPSAEAVVRNDLAATVALALDAAVINGSGVSGQPTGILNTSGVGSVTGTSLAYAGVLEFQSDLLAANSQLVAPGYVTTPAVATTLQGRVKFTNTASPLWEGAAGDGTMCGYRAMSSNQMPTATMLFGDWAEIVVGEWGDGLELEVNPFADFRAGIVGVRAMLSADVAIRHPAAFSAATSIT